jgi:hypothetical protein
MIINKSKDKKSSSFDWLHFAARSGEQGKAWVDLYRRLYPVLELSEKAVQLMRGHRVEEGRKLLDQYLHQIETAQDIPDSMRTLLYRWYYAAKAYYHYCMEEFDEAQHWMHKTGDLVQQAIQQSDFLVMNSIYSLELCLNLARIARNRHCWEEMQAYLEQARAMALDQAPLCELGNQRPVFHSTLREFVKSFEPLSEEELDSVKEYIDPNERLRFFDKSVRRIVRGEFAINYP